MYSFPVSLLPFLGVINLFGDVIITVINGYICPNTNVTVHIQSILRPHWIHIPDQFSVCEVCLAGNFYSLSLNTKQFTFNQHEQEITNIEGIQFTDATVAHVYSCPDDSGNFHLMLGQIKFGFQMTNDHAANRKMTGINVPWVWSGRSRPLSLANLVEQFPINIEQNDNYQYNAANPPLKFPCTPNSTYNITIEHDCPPLQERLVPDTTVSRSQFPTTSTMNTEPSKEMTDHYTIQTMVESDRKANNKKNEKPTKKKIDPRLINCLAVSGSAVIIATVASLVMYFGWYKRKLNQLGLLPQNATPAQN